MQRHIKREREQAKQEPEEEITKKPTNQQTKSGAVACGGV
jgi:hypothetical protein